jgi:hypothetical protein
MEAPQDLTQTCPHCYGPNPAFAQQRCQHCGLVRMSDAEWSRQQALESRLQAIVGAVEEVAAAQNPLPLFARIQPMLEELTPLRSKEAWLEAYLNQVEQRLNPYERAFHKARIQLRIHLLILLILLLAPIMALLMGAVWWLSSLLTLPVLGWGYLGIWKFAKSIGG